MVEKKEARTRHTVIQMRGAARKKLFIRKSTHKHIYTNSQANREKAKRKQKKDREREKDFYC